MKPKTAAKFTHIIDWELPSSSDALADLRIVCKLLNFAMSKFNICWMAPEEDMESLVSRVIEAMNASYQVAATLETTEQPQPEQHIDDAAINILSSTLQLMACQFRMYAKHHEAKGDHEKALHNAKFAELANNVLALVAKGGA